MVAIIFMELRLHTSNLRHAPRYAFSLVELAVALVIIGLLTGGILAGQSLLKSSEIRTVITDFEKYKNAIHTFRNKYDAYPGDFGSATDVWGLAAGTTSPTDVVCLDTYKTGAATCNGNDNGEIAADSTPVGLHIYVERFLAWQHLANAKLIEGTFTGRTNGATSFIGAPGVNAPRSAANTNGFFDVTYIPGPVSANFMFFDGTYEIHALTLFSAITAGGGALKPEEAWNIDKKMDDGRPASGKVFSYKKSSPASGNCADSDVASTAQYDFAITAPNCAPSFSISEKGL